jgi:UDP-N-acetylmuramate dehydrogenase
MASTAQRIELVKKIARLDEDYSLAIFNPLKVGGRADFFTSVTNTVELVEAVTAAIDAEIPYMVIGHGKHVLFSDSGFPGLVISNTTMGLAYDSERSQVVVDSGLLLASCVTQLASRGFAGLTPFFGEPGSVGSAIYRDLVAGVHSFGSLVRSVTLLMPPTRLKPEPTIARYHADWLRREEGKNRLARLREDAALFAAQPILLTAHLQLTSNRTDEIALRLKNQLAGYPAPRKQRLGPIFHPLPNVPVETVLRAAKVDRLRIGGVMSDHKYPNYLAAGKVPTARDVRELIEAMTTQVFESEGVMLRSRYEYEGVW